MKKNISIFLISIFVFLALISASFFALQSKDTNKKAQLGSLKLANLAINEAEEMLKERIEKINNDGLIYNYNKKKVLLPSRVIAFDSELAYEIYNVDTAHNTDRFLNRYNPSLINTLNSFFTKQKKPLLATYRLHQERWWQTLVDIFSEIEKPAKNAYFYFQDNDLKIAQEEFGLMIKKEENFNALNKHLENLSLSELELITSQIEPDIKKEMLLKYEEEILNILEDKNFILKYRKESWPLANNLIITWFTISDDKISLDIDKIIIFLEEELSPDINQEAILPSFQQKENRILNWQAGRNGQELQIEENAKLIKKSILENNEEIEILVEETMGDNVEGLEAEIIEIIGTGHSNFAGSPNNRRHNIKVGAETYHGLIIAPGEEFSVVENLGPITKEGGYLPELVIKDNQTIPEYGGGLCQVSTTLFRTALETGLPITARQNHSYRVSYYEPAGTDAAIYNPWPDLKFINDTNNHIMIQARIEDNDLYFDFWGTNDQREVSISDPIVYNIVSPPPTKLIVSKDLAPGEKKCTERAHNGANAYFDYIVKHKNGETTEKRFNSYYVPWQEVCLVGARGERKRNYRRR